MTDLLRSKKRKKDYSWRVGKCLRIMIFARSVPLSYFSLLEKLVYFSAFYSVLLSIATKCHDLHNVAISVHSYILINFRENARTSLKIFQSFTLVYKFCRILTWKSTQCPVSFTVLVGFTALIALIVQITSIELIMLTNV